MRSKEYRLKGHESFILRDGWLTKGLRAVSQDSKVFSKFSGADALGVGTNMAKAIRYWLRAAGLVNDTPKVVTLTGLGETLFEHDPYFEDTFSLWLVHSNIARNSAQATSWNIFFNDITVSTFSRKELASMMAEKIQVTYDIQPPERSVADDCSAILQMYSGDMDGHEDRDPEEKKRSPFIALGLLKQIENGMFEKTRPAINELDQLIILYLIAERLGTEGIMTIDAVAGDDDMPGKILNLSRVSINDYLDALQSAGYITVNRTAGLDVIYPDNLIPANDVVSKHYEGSME